MIQKLKLIVFGLLMLLSALFYYLALEFHLNWIIGAIISQAVATVFLAMFAITKGNFVKYKKHISVLAEIVGIENISIKEYEKKLYSRDSAPLPGIVMMLFKTTPDVVIKSHDEEALSKLFAYAKENKLPLTLAAAKTSLMAGTVPMIGGIALDLMENKGVINFDETNMLVTVGPATVWIELLRWLELRGYTLGTYPTSSPSSTVGGWTSTGGIGVGSFKYGGSCDQIIDLKIMTLDGKTFHTNPLKLGTRTGYNLNMLGVGTEGTLGLVLDITLKIYHKPELQSNHTITFEDEDNMIGFLNDIVYSDFTPYHVEWKDKYFIELLRALGEEFRSGESMVFVTLEGAHEVVEAEKALLNSLILKWEGRDHGTEKSMEEWVNRFYPLRVKRLGPNIVGGEILIPLKHVRAVLDKCAKFEKTYRTIHGVEGVLGPRTSTTALCDVLVDERKFFSYLTSTGAVIDLQDIGFQHDGRNYTFNAWNSFYINRVFNQAHRDINNNLKKEFDQDRILQSHKTVDFPKTQLLGLKFRPFMFTAALNMLKLLNNHKLLGGLLMGVGGFLTLLTTFMPANFFTDNINFLLGTPATTDGLLQGMVDLPALLASMGLYDLFTGIVGALDYRILGALSWMIFVGVIVIAIGAYLYTKNYRESLLVSWIFILISIVYISYTL